MGYIYLALAIISEVAGTLALQASNGFTRIGPSSVAVVGYGLSLFFLSLVLRTVSVGVAYAIWSGVGIVLISIAGVYFYKQIPDIPAMIGMGMIIAGVAVIHLFSNTTGH